jgi:AcrR family transcriptional regulator
LGSDAGASRQQGLSREAARQRAPSGGAPAELGRQIVQAALACYARFGVRKSTLEDIAKEAGISRATIYRYFPNKDTLLRVVISQEVARILSSIQQELKKNLPIDEKLARALLALESELAGHKVLHAVLEIEPELLLPQLTVDGRASLTMLSSVILPALRKASRNGEIENSALGEKSEWVSRLIVGELAKAGLRKRFGELEEALGWTRQRILPSLLCPPSESLTAEHAGPGALEGGEPAKDDDRPRSSFVSRLALDVSDPSRYGESAGFVWQQATFSAEDIFSGREGRDLDGSENARATPEAMPATEGSSLRSSILEAALRCFARKSVSRTSIEDIAQAAGCARATVYRYFSSKGEIVIESIKHEAQRFFSTLASRLEGKRRFEEVFVVCATTSDELIAGHRVLRVIMEAEPELLLPHVALDAPLVVTVSRSFLEPYIARLIEEGDLAPGEPSEIAEWIVRIILGFLVVPSFRFDLGRPESMYRLASDYIAPCLR